MEEYVKCWRIAKTKHSSTPEEMLSGEGAKQYGGRWNQKGTALLYTSDSPALATLEILVYLQRSDKLPAFNIISFDLPMDVVKYVRDEAIHERITSQLGDKLASRMHKTGMIAIGIPSVIVPSGYSILINPENGQFAPENVNLRKYDLDPRLLPFKR